LSSGSPSLHATKPRSAKASGSERNEATDVSVSGRLREPFISAVGKFDRMTPAATISV
jgi:hypothetical protein